MRSVKRGLLAFFDYFNRIFNLKLDFLFLKKRVWAPGLVLLLAIISRVFQLILVNLLIVFFVCFFIIISQDALLGFLLQS